MSDPETIRVYDDQAAKYAEMTDAHNQDDPHLDAFLNAIPTGGHVLDLGCGPGTSAAAMARAGLTVTATDASAEMVAMADQHPGVRAHQASFEQISGDGIYDGVWANFSLLHAPRANMPDHLSALHSALKPGGMLHIGLKTGTGEKRDAIGRLYTYYTQDELDGLLQTAGFTPVDHAFGAGVGLDGAVADWMVVRAHA
ncbi:methyltransferase domain-containing protein [Aliisedimentitalea scapharcae]|uniref:Methyltransferase domain-containing protein n=1 Tax=Aliisedimentitalea scapharcae TaxID=1524259 RepID=A0ABZ2XU26_9RHOB|nr:class I SAM-dependent methyltransferase [Rhodobacteraceae bacterium M382]